MIKITVGAAVFGAPFAIALALSATPAQAQLPGDDIRPPSSSGSSGQREGALGVGSPGSFKFGEGVHPFVGATMTGGIGVAVGDALGQFSGTSGGSFVFGLRGGVFLGHEELAVELAPASYVFSYGGTSVNEFGLMASFAHYPMIGQAGGATFYWPLRIGLGFVDISEIGELAIAQRIDVVGFAFNLGHFLGEVHLPSVRNMAATSYGIDIVMVQFGVSGSYVL